MTLCLVGRDYTSKLLDTKSHYAFANMTAAEQARKIMAKHPELKAEIRETTKKYPRSLHIERSEWEILQELATQESEGGRDFVCYVDGPNFYFGPRKRTPKIVANLYYRKGDASNVISADFDDCSIGQVSKVTVRHWTKKAKVEGSAEDTA